MQSFSGESVKDIFKKFLPNSILGFINLQITSTHLANGYQS
jgi:hypothetical protein